MRAILRTIVQNRTMVSAVTTGVLAYGFGYQFVLKFEDDILVKDKYVKHENGQTMYMITDTDNRIYKFENSLWRLHWKRAEQWNSVEKNYRYRVKGVGIRSPLLGMYPNIYSVKELN